MNIFQQLYNFLFKEPQDDKNDELFNTNEYVRLKHINYKKCPQCGVECSTNQEVIETFGKRTASGHPDVQSWCKECRKHKTDTIDTNNSTDNLF